MTEKILYKELAYKVVGCFFKVYNELGSGFKENIYHNALSIEISVNKIPFVEEKQLQIRYRDHKVGVYVPDFIIDEKILIEIKAVEFLPKTFEKQLYYYLKGTNYKLGYLVNFGADKLDIRRRIYDTIRENSRSKIDEN